MKCAAILVSSLCLAVSVNAAPDGVETCPSCAVCPDFLNGNHTDTTLTADCRMSGGAYYSARIHVKIESGQSVVVRSEEGQKYTIYADGSHSHFYNRDGTLELYNVRLTGGYADDGGNTYGGHGGAVSNDGGTFNAVRCDFYGNRADRNGQDIHTSSSGTTTLQNCEFLTRYTQICGTRICGRPLVYGPVESCSSAATPCSKCEDKANTGQEWGTTCVSPTSSPTSLPTTSAPTVSPTSSPTSLPTTAAVVSAASTTTTTTTLYCLITSTVIRLVLSF